MTANTLALVFILVVSIGSMIQSNALNLTTAKLHSSIGLNQSLACIEEMNQLYNSTTLLNSILEVARDFEDAIRECMEDIVNCEVPFSSFSVFDDECTDLGGRTELFTLYIDCSMNSTSFESFEFDSYPTCIGISCTLDMLDTIVVGNMFPGCELYRKI